MDLLKVRTSQFEGPLDLMLFLIQRNELDISSISLHQITDQYVQYVNLMREINVDIASEFLLMASILIYIKSKKLLPGGDDGALLADDTELPKSEEELLRRLRELKAFQEAGYKILALPRLGVDVFSRPNVPAPEKHLIWKEMEMTGLALAIQDVLRRSRKRTKIIIRESISLPERIMQLGQLLTVGVRTEFSKIINEDMTRTDIVVTFIALLELARLKKLRVMQNESFTEIYILLYEPIDALDPTLMTGFQYKAHDSVAATLP